MIEDRDPSQPDFHPLEQRLRDERPTLTELEARRVRERATAGRARAGTRAARLAMVSLVSGALLIGGSGAALAVSGSSGDGRAGAAQYKQNVPTETSPLAPSQVGGVQGEGDTGGGTDPEDGTETSPDGDAVAPGSEVGSTDPAQTVRQASSERSDGRLPFTGLAAIPLLGLGVLMLAGGLVLRRRSAAGPVS